MLRKLFILALIAALASPVAACGRKSKPETPKDATYPKTYPNPYH